jgi:hypothetical protein
MGDAYAHAEANKGLQRCVRKRESIDSGGQNRYGRDRARTVLSGKEPAFQAERQTGHDVNKGPEKSAPIGIALDESQGRAD